MVSQFSLGLNLILTIGQQQIKDNVMYNQDSFNVSLAKLLYEAPAMDMILSISN